MLRPGKGDRRRRCRGRKRRGPGSGRHVVTCVRIGCRRRLRRWHGVTGVRIGRLLLAGRCRRGSWHDMSSMRIGCLVRRARSFRHAVTGVRVLLGSRRACRGLAWLTSRHDAVAHCRMFSGARRRRLSLGLNTGCWCLGSRRLCRGRLGRAVTHGGVLGRTRRVNLAGRACSGLLLRRRGWLMSRMLGESGRGESAGKQPDQEGLHAASPSIGRTLTTRIMPACMW